MLIIAGFKSGSALASCERQLYYVNVFLLEPVLNSMIYCLDEGNIDYLILFANHAKALQLSYMSTS